MRASAAQDGLNDASGAEGAEGVMYAGDALLRGRRDIAER